MTHASIRGARRKFLTHCPASLDAVCGRLLRGRPTERDLSIVLALLLRPAR